MSSRLSILVVALLVAAACGAGDDADRKRNLVGEAAPAPVKAPPPRTPGRELHAAAFVVDLIQNIVFREARDGWTLTTPEAHTSAARQREGGVDLLLSAMPAGASADPSVLEAELAAMEALAAGSGGAAAMVDVAEARDAAAKGIVPIAILLEGADALEKGDLAVTVPGLERRGVMAIGLVAEGRNAFADPASSPSDPGGLSARGIELVQRCRESGVVIDLTHASRAAFWDVLAGQGVAAAVTHTAARALRDHPRNLDDVQIIGLARAGGVLGLTFNPDFLVTGDPPRASLEDVVAHLEHARKLGAGSALALGTDFGGIIPPSGLEDVSRLPALTVRLSERGFSEDELRGLLGGNALRVLEAAEAGQGTTDWSARPSLRPIPIECDAASGEFSGELVTACDGYVLAGGAKLAASTTQRLRLKDPKRAPVELELFGDPGTPWQVEAQDLAGKILIRRIVALGKDGRGALPLPEGRNLTRLFVSPTRASTLREAVVWGR